eukprot:Em0003g1140a
MPIIHQCTGTLDYMGLNGRLVIPPLTDRIYLTLSRALPCWYWKDEAPIRGFGPAAVLVMACELKQGPPGQNKDVVLMRPLRDMNFPKFVFEVFLGLIGDFFPGLDCPRVHYPKFNDAMEGVPSDGKHIQLPHRDGVCGSKEVGIQLCYVLKALLAIHIGQMTPLWSLTLWWLSTGFSGSSCGGMIDTYVKQQAQLPGLLDLGRSPPTTSTVQYSFAAQVGAVVRYWDVAMLWDSRLQYFAELFEGKQFLVAVDAFSKWPEVVIMEDMSTDRTLDELRVMFASKSSPYHPTTNGLAEHFVQALKQALQASKKEKKSLSHRVSSFLIQYGNARHSTLDTTPAQMMIKRDLRCRLHLLRPNVRDSVFEKQSTQADTRMT